MAWLASHYPLEADAGEDKHEGSQAERLAAEQSCGPGGRPVDRLDHHIWARYVGMAVDWAYENRENSKLRNRVAHVGGHFADYGRSELLVRYGALLKKYTAVYNGCYKHVYNKYAPVISQYCSSLQLLNQMLLQDRAVPIGDVMETAFAIMWYRDQWLAIWRFLELFE